MREFHEDESESRAVVWIIAARRAPPGPFAAGSRSRDLRQRGGGAIEGRLVEIGQEASSRSLTVTRARPRLTIACKTSSSPWGPTWPSGPPRPGAIALPSRPGSRAGLDRAQDDLGVRSRSRLANWRAFAQNN